MLAYSVKKMAQTEAIINIIRTFFVSCVFAIAAIFFNSITNKWVMLPIERMLEKVLLGLSASFPVLCALGEVDIPPAQKV